MRLITRFIIVLMLGVNRPNKKDLSLLSTFVVDNQSTDNSSNTNSVSDERQLIAAGNDLLERPKSNPFQGGTFFECEEDDEFKNIFQGKRRNL